MRLVLLLENVGVDGVGVWRAGFRLVLILGGGGRAGRRSGRAGSSFLRVCNDIDLAGLHGRHLRPAAEGSGFRSSRISQSGAAKRKEPGGGDGPPSKWQRSVPKRGRETGRWLER